MHTVLYKLQQHYKDELESYKFQLEVILGKLPE